MKILHIITGLSLGGAENTLLKICEYTKNKKIENTVISLTNYSIIGEQLEKLNIKVFNLNLKKNFYAPFKIYHFYKLIKKIKPDIIQTWMFHADFFGGILGKLCGIKRIYWNFRHSNLKVGKSKISTIILYYFLIPLSYFIPNYIICCSKKTIYASKKKLFHNKKFIYIANGFDLKTSPLHSTYIDNTKFTLGMLANYRPQKNHLALIKALFELKKEYTNFVCLLAGENVDNNNKQLIKLINNFDLSKEIILLGKIKDVSEYMHKLDLHVLSSDFGEAFPNVIAEAMSCKILCIANDVGDSKEIISDTGIIVDTNNSFLFAQAIYKLINIKLDNSQLWEKKRNKAKQIIENNYNMKLMCNNYLNVWNKL